MKRSTQFGDEDMSALRSSSKVSGFGAVKRPLTNFLSIERNSLNCSSKGKKKLVLTHISDAWYGTHATKFDVNENTLNTFFKLKVLVS